ncbi:MAG: hypothetical protein QM710_10315 [Flavobacterium sp.]
MPIKKFISFGQLLALLLLFGFTAAAKPAVAKNEFHEKGALSLNKIENSFHKNMLQPQVVHVNMVTEDSVKPISSGYAVLFFYENTALSLPLTGQTNQTLQDCNRCESVSKLLFPFHYFW